MVREIIHVQVGQCGNEIGNAFWNTVRLEHRLSHKGKYESRDEIDDYKRLNKIDVFFREAGTSRFVPRACLIDLEPDTLDLIKASPMGNMFKPDNFCFGATSAGNNWAKGHYTEGAELIDEAVDIIRREAEGCDCPQGFQLTHSIGGGTGGGMGALLLLQIRDNYPDRITSTYTVYPSKKVSEVVVEPYNATLSIHHLIENSDETFVLDNEALFNIAHNVLKQKKPKYADLNWVISMVMSGITASLRFSGELNSDIRKLGVNLVPFPRLHFFLCSQAPLCAIDEGNKINLTVQALTDQMWSSCNFLAAIKPEDGKYLTSSCIYRGSTVVYKTIIDGFIRSIGMDRKHIPIDIVSLLHQFYSYGFRFGGDNDSNQIIPTQEVEDEIAKIQQKMAGDFVNWIPNNVKSTIVGVSQNQYNGDMSGTFVANTTAIKGVFQRISAQFAKMYKRKAFLHHYKAEGMHEMEYQEADKNCRDLITEYQDKQDAVVDIDDPYGGVDDEEDYSDDEEDDDDSDEDDDDADDEFY